MFMQSSCEVHTHELLGGCRVHAVVDKPLGINVYREKLSVENQREAAVRSPGSLNR